MRRAKSAIAASATMGVLLSALTWLPASPAQAAPQTYSYTGSPQLYVVPPGVTSLSVTLNGAGGLSLSGGGVGGEGGSVSAVIAVQPGESLMFNVGGAGISNAAAFNGGGRPGGGGATDIRRPTPSTPLNTVSSCAYDFNCALAQQIVVAGGGGGGGNISGADGGDGGSSGAAGIAGNLAGGDATGGSGGTTSAGGVAGTGTISGGGSAGSGSGTRGAGGGNGWAVGAFGGGGGGGYYGGGQGGQSSDGSGGNLGAGGGGGGSSWAGGIGVSGATFQTGGTPGHGSITVDPPSAIQGASFGYTGAAQNYTVPADVTELSVRITGGGASAQGDVVYGRLPVTSGQVLELNIGSAATPVSLFNGSYVGGQGGWNGGGNATQTYPGTYGGGGASDLRVSPYSLDDRVVVAGGGGGCYAPWLCPGNGWTIGKGGEATTGEGGTSRRNPGDMWYAGGRLNRGGAWVLPPSGTGGDDTTAPAGTVGTFGVGGSGDAGGGGGYWGGAGGPAGGGGSSYASVSGPDATRQGVGNVLGVVGAPFAHDRGGNSGDGIAVITAMPIGITTSGSLIDDTSALIQGSVNPKYLASKPKVFYDTSQTTVANGGGSSAAITGPSAAVVLAGDTVQAVSGTITGLTAGSTYYYRVCAESVAGNGCGAILSFSTPQAGYPYFTADTPDDSAIAGTAYTSYTFLAASNPSASIVFGVASGSLPPGLTLDATTGVLSGTPTTAGSYTFTIGATNATGTTTTAVRTINVAPNPTPPTPPSPPSPVPPSAPTTVTALAGNTEATITWGAPANPGSFPVTNYEVVARPGGASCLTRSTSCTLTGLTNGVEYTFSVRALNGAGWSSASESNAVTPLKPEESALTLFQGVRVPAGRHDRIVTGGSSTGIPEGVKLTPHIRYGTAEWKDGVATITVQADGSFTWKRLIRKDKKLTAYVSYEDTNSNEVIWLKVR